MDIVFGNWVKKEYGMDNSIKKDNYVFLLLRGYTLGINFVELKSEISFAESDKVRVFFNPILKLFLI